jgi:hypothetical protein
MKKTLILLTAFILFGCGDKKPTRHVNHKFNTGDIVYVKVDNNRAVINSRTIFRDTIPAYYIDYKDSDGDYTEQAIEEFNLSKTKQ